MPDRKQEELLKKGAKAWNDSFTVLVRDGRPDLREARLPRASSQERFCVTRISRTQILAMRL